MSYLDFYNIWHHRICFNINQVLAWDVSFQRSNLSRWINKGYIRKLRKEWYIFSDCLSYPGIQYLIANKIYAPSYVSLQSALCFYGIIPESVVDVTSVSARDTKHFESPLGLCFYSKIKRELFFGYRVMEFDKIGAIKFATPEKAILDFLYFNSFYNTQKDMIELRFDETFMQEELDRDLLFSLLSRFNNKRLENRITTLIDSYS
ncbi:MAG: hypothetical protein J1F07_08670 [Muribaculaceae bacterium]|nr:hypothetical protein [Muribaculaceae bacterium]